MFLDTLQRWVADNRAALEADGVTIKLSEPSDTPNPAQSLTMTKAEREADVVVWVSGECEVAIGHVDGVTLDAEQTHHDFSSPDQLVAVLGELAAKVRSGDL